MNQFRGTNRQRKASWWVGVLMLAAIGTGTALGKPGVALEHVVLHRDDTMYYIAPSLAALPNGDILMSLREAHVRPPERISHVDVTARSVLLRSRDGGRTFGEKRVMDDETYRFSSSQDTTITVLRDGSLLASLYSWGMAPAGTSAGRSAASRTFEGLWTLRSTDEGRTWTPRRPVEIAGQSPFAARAPVVELPDGTLLLQVNDYKLGADGRRLWSRIYCLRSVDRGATWSESVLVADGAEYQINFVEPSLVRLRGGRLLSLLRTHRGGSVVGYLFQSVSDDDGRTWSKPEQTPIWGFPAHVLELQDGRLFCAYSYRRPPFGVRATLSQDGGRTWDVANEIVLRDDGGNVDLGYPVSLEFPDGRILVAYWFNQEKKGDPESAVRYIAGTFLQW